MSDPALKISGLDKAYRIWRSPASRLQAAMLGGLANLVPPMRQGIARYRSALYHDFFALRGIDFEVRRGESVAIIGRNGSGKSTLLQVVAGTLPPTRGTIETNGRVAALLELGSGFNPEYTGRENVLLNATVLGLTPAQAKERFPAIEEFADIGEFIDQPVKTYSTGMAVRLAFAVLTQIEPEILIIDEALAVGDFLFQQKCFDVIRKFRASGCTFLFVSHSMGSVLELCDRAVLLEGGKMSFIGPADEAVRLYEATGVKALFSETSASRTVTPGTWAEERKLRDIDPDSAGNPEPQTPSMDTGSLLTEKAELLAVELTDGEGRLTEVVTSGKSVLLSIRVRFAIALDDPHIGFKIRDKFGRIIFETSSYCLRKAIGPVAAGQELLSQFAFEMPLEEGEYSVVIGVANGGYGQHHYRELILYLQGTKTFQIIKNRREPLWSGIVNLRPHLNCSVSSGTSASK
ncbi:MAG: ABC transporter ATP-binding protein [Opitutaceae bacterium]|nr:ABC transporter ATP-binding protein [Opitutaceae bacterium]